MDYKLDYYGILQVHAAADQDTIDSIYRTMCKKYHPDVNRTPEAENRMKMINIAYEVLGNEKSRREYDRMRRVDPSVRGFGRAADPESMAEAERTVRLYFTALAAGDYRAAYPLLCTADRTSMPLASFMEWRKAVHEVFSIISVSVQRERYYPSFAIGKSRVCEACKFRIDVTEKNVNTGLTGRDTFYKYAVYEDGGWRVFLGYDNLRDIADLFKLSVDQKSEQEFLKQWRKFREENDIGLGMLNARGLLERAKSEVYRYKRYQRKMSVCAIRIGLKAGGKLDGRLMYHVAELIKKGLREIDISASVSPGLFAVILAEADDRNKNLVVGRLVEKIKKEIMESYRIELVCSYYAVEYKGGEIDAMLRHCIELAERGFVQERGGR